jgi:hypothetical protein
MPSEMPFERATNKAVGELLVERGFVTAEQCEQALAYAREHGRKIGEALVELGFIPHDLLSSALGEQFGTRPMVIEPSMLDFDLIRRFPIGLLRAHHLLPLIDLGDELIVAVGDPNDREGLEALAQLAPRHRLVFELADAEDVARCLAHPQLAGESPAPPLPASQGSPEVSPSSPIRALEEAIVSTCSRPGVAALEARLCAGETLWWQHGFEPADRRPLGALDDSFDNVAAFLGSRVQWLPDAAWRAGFLEALEGCRIAVTVDRDLNGATVMLRCLRPAPPQPGPAFRWPPLTHRVVFLLYDTLDSLSAAATVYAKEAGARPLVMVTEHLSWLFEPVIQLPLGGSVLPDVARRAHGRSVFVDHLLLAGGLAQLLAGVPTLHQVVHACARARWCPGLLRQYETVLSAFDGVIVEATPDGLVAVEGGMMPDPQMEGS